MDFYDKINQLLKERKIKKNKMCEDLNIPYNTLMSMFNRRSRNITIDVIEKIADYLDVSVDYLVRNDIVDTQYGKGNLTIHSGSTIVPMIEKYELLDDRYKNFVNEQIESLLSLQHQESE